MWSNVHRWAPSTFSALFIIQSCNYTFDKQSASLKQLGVMHLAQGYFSSSDFMLFNPGGCGGGINRFKSTWEEFSWKISTTHAHIHPNQRIFPRLKNRLFLSLFPRANHTFAWCRFGEKNVLDYNELVAVWSLFLAVFTKRILYGTSNTLYGSHSSLYSQIELQKEGRFWERSLKFPP